VAHNDEPMDAAARTEQERLLAKNTYVRHFLNPAGRVSIRKPLTIRRAREIATARTQRNLRRKAKKQGVPAWQPVE
jgi:hypothetical protein